MKTLHLSLITATIALLIGCGGGGSSDSTNTSGSTSSSSVTASYDYNSDGTAVRSLNNEAVNTYVQTAQLLESLKTDETAFNTQIDRFISEMLQNMTSQDDMLSYAPRGSNKSMNVTVTDGVVDYSAYLLDGDANGDYSVDWKDIELLKSALFGSSNAYDMNSDGNTDIKDLIYTCARINTEIASFDFYTTSGEKLSLATRSINEAKSVAYTGGESTVMVVAKDANGASGFTAGLSDSDEVWYKKSGWVYSDSELIYESNPATAPSLRIAASVMVRESVRAVTNMEVSPYLTGWHFSVSFVETGGFDGFGETGIDQFAMFLTEAKGKIDSHFMKSTMGHPGSVAQTQTEYVYHIGSTGGEQNEVNADNLSYASAYTLDGDTVTIKRIVHAASVLYESAPTNTLKGKVNADVTLNGEITFDRIGPSPQEDTFEGTVNGNDVEIKNIPLGEYTATMKTSCECPLTLGSFIYDTPTSQANFNLSDSAVKGTITIDVVNPSDEPLSGKYVTIEADSCLDQGTGGSSFLLGGEMATDDLGEAVFEDMAFGDYRVSVDGKYMKTIHVCTDSREKVVLSDTWYLKYSASSPSFGSGTMIVKNFTYKCEDAHADPYYGKTCSEVDTYTPDTSITYSGSFTRDPNLTPLYIFEHGLQLSVLYPYIDGERVDWQGGVDLNVLTGENYATGDGCLGVWADSYSQNLESGTAFNIAISGNGASCNLEFKPCTQELCQ